MADFSDPTIRANWLQDVKVKLGLDYQDFYNLKFKDIRHIPLFSQFQRNCADWISEVENAFPQYDWKFYRFDRVINRWQHSHYQKQWWQDFKNDLNITTQEQMYKLSRKDLVNHTRSTINLFRIDYNNEHSSFIMAMEPQFDWKPYRFVNTPFWYWKDLKNQRQWFEDLMEHEGWQTWEDCYQITQKKIKNFNGDALISKSSPHCSSIIELLQTLVPECDWKFYKLGQAPAGYWDDPQNQQMWWDDFYQHMGCPSQKEMYKITHDDVIAFYGCSLLNRRYSIYDLIKNFNPHLEWDDSLFAVVPYGFYEDWNNRKKLFDRFCDYYNITNWEQLYDIEHEQVAEVISMTMFGGTSKGYYDSIKQWFIDMVPEFKFKGYLFSMVERNYWDSMENRREVIYDLMEAKGWQLEDLYQLKIQDIRDMGAATMAARYMDSTLDMLCDLFPEFNWKPHRFKKVGGGYWGTREKPNRKSIELYWQDLCKHFSLSALEDFPQMTQKELTSFYGGGPMASCGPRFSWYELCCYMMPDIDWDRSVFDKKGKNQGLLYRILRDNLDSSAILEWKSEGKFSQSGRRMGYDIYLPKFNAVIEYQGFQHYTWKENVFGGEKSHKQLVLRDAEKKKWALDNNYIYLEIPNLDGYTNLPGWQHNLESFLEIAKLQGVDFDLEIGS